jgi:hypothetical protein
MSNTTVNSALQVKNFLAEFFQEYIRDNRFSKYMGTDNNAVITTKEGKQIINIPFVTRLKGNGVSGSSTLDGNEEQIGNYGMNLIPTYFRHGVRMTLEEKDKPAFDLMRASRSLLMEWAKELVRDQIIQAMGAAITGTDSSVNYGTASGANLDIWNTNNQDRILYGKTKSNNSAGNHTASLGNIDTTNDKMTAAIVSLAKRMAKTADPHITPLKTKDDQEWYVMFSDPFAFRDFKEDSTIAQANREARTRGTDNPIFTDGDLVYDGVIIREVPEIAYFIDGTSGSNGVWGGAATADGLNTAGNGSTRVGVSFLCGQQAVCFGLGQRPGIQTDSQKDYGFQPGVAVQLKQQIRKANFNSKQHGMITVFTSSAKDS